METTQSKDGTKIAYDRTGTGPAVILIQGALSARLSWSGPELARLLAPRFTVFNYDRRGRGDSGDALPYAVAREIEDIAALIERAGGKAALYGHSSGAALALDAAAALGTKVTKLAMYETPYNDAPEARQSWIVYIQELTALLNENRKGDAVALFMRYLGTPVEQVEGMRHAPFWPYMEAIAPTLAYDHTAILGEENAIPLQQARSVQAPTLVMSGDAGMPFMQVTAKALSETIPRAHLRILNGQTHDVSPEVLAPVLAEFFA